MFPDYFLTILNRGKKLAWIHSFIFFLLFAIACGENLSEDAEVGLVGEAAFAYQQSYQNASLQTVIKSKPVKLSNSDYAKFKFSCTSPPCNYRCQLDRNSWQKCKSPLEYFGLMEGAHIFKVQAKDQSGKVDQTPAIYNWTVKYAGTWLQISEVNAPEVRYDQNEIWTGTEMIIWGGFAYPEGSVWPYNLKSGARYDPSQDSWTPTSQAGAPYGGQGFSAVWTGTEMIIWGGDSYSKSIGRYNPVTDSWEGSSSYCPLEGRAYHSAVWTGREMIIWGGWQYYSDIFGDGAQYDPTTDSWSLISNTNAPSARSSHSAFWTGTEMLIWGSGGSAGTNTGARYNPNTDSWKKTSTKDAPPGLISYSAIWTGSKMLVWGGYYYDEQGDYRIITNQGYVYNPETDSWKQISKKGAPSARHSHSAVWTGSEMIIWGGASHTYLSTGGIYNPETNSWKTISYTDAPEGRIGSSAVWTGSEMIIWGGYYNNDSERYELTDGAIFFP